MAYDSPRFRGETTYSDEPGYPGDAAYPSFASDGPDPAGQEPFGDPIDFVEPPPMPRPARDRLAVHFVWEFVLLLAVAAVAFLLDRAAPNSLRGNNLGALLIGASALGFVATGMAVSLRAAVPNLAVGPLAYATGLFFAENSDRGLLVTASVSALLAAAVGVAIAVVVTAFHVPSWAASLGAAFGIILWIELHRDVVEVVNGAYRPTAHPQWWFGAFAAVSILAGAVALVPAVRRLLGRFRPSADPSRRETGAGVAAFALIVSSLLAAVSGVLLALYNREVSATENGLALTGLALGAALLGGASIYGRIGGVFGTLLAACLMTALIAYADAKGWVLHSMGLAAAAIGIGLAVSRLVETLSRRRHRPVRAEETEDLTGLAPEFPVAGREPGRDAFPGVNGRDQWAEAPPDRRFDEPWDERWAAR